MVNEFQDILTQGKQVTTMIKASRICLFLALAAVSFFSSLFSRLTSPPCVMFIVSANNTTTTYGTPQIKSFSRTGMKKEINVKKSFILRL